MFFWRLFPGFHEELHAFVSAGCWMAKKEERVLFCGGNRGSWDMFGFILSLFWCLCFFSFSHLLAQHILLLFSGLLIPIILFSRSIILINPRYSWETIHRGSPLIYSNPYSLQCNAFSGYPQAIVKASGIPFLVSLWLGSFCFKLLAFHVLGSFSVS